MDDSEDNALLLVMRIQMIHSLILTLNQNMKILMLQSHKILIAI